MLYEVITGELEEIAAAAAGLVGVGDGEGVGAIGRDGEGRARSDRGSFPTAIVARTLSPAPSIATSEFSRNNFV